MTAAPAAPEPVGCLAVLIGFNGVAMGTWAAGFAAGPFSSPEQMLWYRGGSLAFLLPGAILPTMALMMGARRSKRAMRVVTAGALIALLAFPGYLTMSGGGV